MSKKTNQEIIKEYLVGENGYLKNDISNGKVIMLSGKWGSGKTHFWLNQIADDSLKKKLKTDQKAYSYISLYGKSSIVEIENDIFSQVYSDSIGGENIVTKTASTFTKLTKRYGGFSSLIDFSILAEAGEEEQNDNKERIALSRLENGGVICFDDFERKSKDIDLNDLFGFVTQLTLNFNCKVVIILNDDVFQGEEKQIFTNVKEKSVSKFVYYSPTIDELFDSIFNSSLEKYEQLIPYKDIIVNSIIEIGEVNARIYMQVFDNLNEWIINGKEKDNNIIRSLILVNILFILYHTLFYRDEKEKYFALNFNDKLKEHSNRFNSIQIQSVNLFSNSNDYKFKFYENFNKYYNIFESSIIKNDNNVIYKDFLENNYYIYKSKYYANYLNIAKNISSKTLKEINEFIETGILINEKH